MAMDVGGTKKTKDHHPVAADAVARGAGVARRGDTTMVLFVCVLTLPLLLFLFGGRAVWLQNAAPAAPLTSNSSGLRNVSRPSAAGADGLFGGLLSQGSDRRACLSRHQIAHYYKHSPYAPSPHLLRKLRHYEARHSKCGPRTPPYARSVDHLRSGGGTEDTECNYLVWIPYNGLGNRMLSLLSAFLYAILTGRVLLVHSTDDFTGLFCEPFPGANATWVLPPDFPIADISELGVHSNQSYGNLLDGQKIANDPAKATARTVPPYVYLHLAHDLRRSDRRFYCNNDQLVLSKVNWLLLQSDFYFVPALYDMTEFDGELRRLFPAKESVAHLLGRYLFHPSNAVWGMITRYHRTYMAQAEERIGVQIRMFSWATIPTDDMYGQIMACSRQERILPDIDVDVDDAAAAGSSHGDGGSKPKAILIASLQADYYDRIKWRYYEHAAKGGGAVGVFQPSHEERQMMGRRSHNRKALAEIYLLSFSDVLLTTGASTFGYVSSSLAGLRPTMLMVPEDGKVPEPPCVRAVSMEPCFHMTPDVQCQGKAVDKEELSRHVKECEDVGDGIKWIKGIKLFD